MKINSSLYPNQSHTLLSREPSSTNQCQEHRSPVHMHASKHMGRKSAFYLSSLFTKNKKKKGVLVTANNWFDIGALTKALDKNQLHNLQSPLQNKNVCFLPQKLLKMFKTVTANVKPDARPFECGERRDCTGLHTCEASLVTRHLRFMKYPESRVTLHSFVPSQHINEWIRIT